MGLFIFNRLCVFLLPSYLWLCLVLISPTYASLIQVTKTQVSDNPISPRSNSNTFSDDISCYTLPFGGFGFASHLLTYYTIIILSLERRPLAPWKTLEHSGRNYWLVGTKLVVTTATASISMARCHKTWQFLAMAAWKLDFSLTYGLLSFHVNARGAEKSHWWLLLYVPGVIAGLAAVFSLAGSTINSNRDVMLVTAAFGAASGAVTVGLIIWGFVKLVNDSKDDVVYSGRDCCIYTAKALFKALFGYGVPLVVFGVLGALYSDWILASVAHDMLGYPTEKTPGAQALWVLYFIAKRLTMFMT